MEVRKGQKYVNIFEHPFMNLDQEWTKTTITNTVMNIYWCIYSYIYRTSAGLPPLSAHYHDWQYYYTITTSCIPPVLLFHYYQRYTASNTIAVLTSGIPPDIPNQGFLAFSRHIYPIKDVWRSIARYTQSRASGGQPPHILNQYMPAVDRQAPLAVGKNNLICLRDQLTLL